MISKSKRRKNSFARKSRTIKGGRYSSQKRLTLSQEAIKTADEARQGKEAARIAREVAAFARVKKTEANAAKTRAEIVVSSVKKQRKTILEMKFIKEQHIDFPTGDTYDGEIDHGMPNGFGIYTKRDQYKFMKYRYIGQFLHGKMHGIGSLTYHNDRSYEGEWKNDERDGLGKIITGVDSDGMKETYEGEFKNDTPNGVGVMKIDRSLYEGEFVNGNPERGKCTIRGNEYEGDFNYDTDHGYGLTFHGFGVFKIARRGVYEGTFEYNHKHGYGTFTTLNEETYSGSFVEDEDILTQGTKMFEVGVYTGDLKKGSRHGKGRLELMNGDVYDGYFKNNKKYGTGKLTKMDGTVYEGVWSGDKMQGTVTYPNGAHIYNYFALFSSDDVEPIDVMASDSVQDNLSGNVTE
jgi:hypothetical protein